MNVIVVYNSKTGFTKKYASWIAEELNCNFVSYKDISTTLIDDNCIVIFGSSIHAGKIEYLSKIIKLLNRKPTIDLIVFATGGTPAAAKNIIDKIWKDNFSKTELTSIPHFYMQSGLNYEKMA